MNIPESGCLSVRLEKPEPGNDTLNLVMSPVEWKEIHALAKFGQTGIAYDCETPYVAQVFVYTATEPERFRDDENLKAAFKALDDLAARTAPDGKNGRDVVLALSKEKMRQLLVIGRKAAESERQANRLHSAIPERFPHAFPDIGVSCQHYEDAFSNLVLALHEDKDLSISRP